MKKLTLLLICAAAIACGKLTEKAKESINKGGEAVGKSATEFIEGVSGGIDKTLQCEVLLSESIKNQGVGIGKVAISNSQEGGQKNLLTVYLIFEKDFKSVVLAKAFDKNGLEIGRAKVEITNTAENAGYYDFTFDKRTVLEAKSKIILEK